MKKFLQYTLLLFVELEEQYTGTITKLQDGLAKIK